MSHAASHPSTALFTSRGYDRPCFLHVGTSCTRILGFMLRPLYLRGKCTNLYPLNGMGGPQNLFARRGHNFCLDCSRWFTLCMLGLNEYIFPVSETLLLQVQTGRRIIPRNPVYHRHEPTDLRFLYCCRRTGVLLTEPSSTNDSGGRQTSQSPPPVTFQNKERVLIIIATGCIIWTEGTRNLIQASLTNTAVVRTCWTRDMGLLFLNNRSENTSKGRN
jgi:hypothetical protein